MALHSKRRDAPEVPSSCTAGRPLLEAQVVDAADSLAYDTHDVDDALSIDLIEIADLADLAFWRRARERAESKYGPCRHCTAGRGHSRPSSTGKCATCSKRPAAICAARRIGSVADVRRLASNRSSTRGGGAGPQGRAGGVSLRKGL